ncbi:MAG: HDOD domain-containing protein [Proteobacteria bacterium]|nr:HDOD domain-containing protein [Pseudomonadota bacterium]
MGATGAGHCWAATACRALGEALHVGHEEDLFLAGLLQDVAILAIAKTSSDFYASLSPEATHSRWSRTRSRSLEKTMQPLAQCSSNPGTCLNGWRIA